MAFDVRVEEGSGWDAADGVGCVDDGDRDGA